VFRSKPASERARVRNMSECWFRRIGDASRSATKPLISAG